MADSYKLEAAFSNRSLTFASRFALFIVEAFVIKGSDAVDHRIGRAEEGTKLGHAIALVVWLTAGVVAFLPFAFNTSPWNAVTLQVPGNQGNWWHVLVGAPFFLAFPMIWLRGRLLFSGWGLSPAGRRLLWSAVGLSVLGTLLVETPFLLHLAGTSAWQRLSVLSLGIGIVAVSAILLLVHRRSISADRACMIAVNTAYAANAALCLVVYSEATGSIWSQLGWRVTMVILWPIVLEILWLSLSNFNRPAIKAGASIA